MVVAATRECTGSRLRSAGWGRGQTSLGGDRRRDPPHGRRCRTEERWGPGEQDPSRAPTAPALQPEASRARGCVRGCRGRGGGRSTEGLVCGPCGGLWWTRASALHSTVCADAHTRLGLVPMHACANGSSWCRRARAHAARGVRADGRVRTRLALVPTRACAHGSGSCRRARAQTAPAEPRGREDREAGGDLASSRPSRRAPRALRSQTQRGGRPEPGLAAPVPLHTASRGPGTSSQRTHHPPAA